jgi:hypothetical protein
METAWMSDLEPPLNPSDLFKLAQSLEDVAIRSGDIEDWAKVLELERRIAPALSIEEVEGLLREGVED